MSGTNKETGYLAGEICNRNGCQGIIDEYEKKSCSCHINPPCSACTEPRGYCPECGWDAKEEEITEQAKGPSESDKKFLNTLREMRDRPLDDTKIDWKTYSHTHFSMILKGVYPAGTTRSEVLNLVKGTFGGRFTQFGNGKFEYIAYTD